MINQLAHVTPLEIPAGLLLMATGFVLGALAVIAWKRFRIS